MSDIVVVAKARARAGREADTLRAFREVMQPTHAEEGCQRYALHQAADDPRTFVMIERWSSKELLDRHLASPHVQHLFATLADLVEGPAEIAVLNPMSDDLGDQGRL